MTEITGYSDEVVDQLVGAIFSDLIFSDHIADTIRQHCGKFLEEFHDGDDEAWLQLVCTVSEAVTRKMLRNDALFIDSVDPEQHAIACNCAVCRNRPRVEVEVVADGNGAGGVYIRDRFGEVVSWTTDEFAEDASVALAALNAVVLAYTRGTAFLRSLTTKEG